MVKRNKSLENKLRHNCPTCQSSYTLLETHLTRKDNQSCPTNCRKVWEAIIHKYCQEKVLGAELAENQKEEDLKDFLKDKNHGSH